MKHRAYETKRFVRQTEIHQPTGHDPRGEYKVGRVQGVRSATIVYLLRDCRSRAPPPAPVSGASANGKEEDGPMTETTPNNTSSSQNWPPLRVDEWTTTRDTLHMWTQIVGKIRLAKAPMVNHWWQVTLYVSSRGLTTSAIPYEAGVFDIEFDFIEHQLHIRSSDGCARRIALEPKSVADFYTETTSALDELGIAVQIRARPNEVDPAIPFADDHTLLLRPPTPCTCSGANSCRPTASCTSSARISSARSARCTSSGERWI